MTALIPPVPQAAPLVLSKGLATHKAERGLYTAYNAKSRRQCDECVRCLHEAKGVGPMVRGARFVRAWRPPTDHPKLYLCSEHAELWRALDGYPVSPKPRKR